MHRKSHSSSVLETDQRADGSCLKNMRHLRIYARVSCPELSDRRISADPCRRPFAASACQQSFTLRHVGAVRKQRGTRPPTATWSRSKLRSEQSVNNWLPDSRQWHVPSQAKPLKNQQDAAPALSYEPGGRTFESLGAEAAKPRRWRAGRTIFQSVSANAVVNNIGRRAFGENQAVVAADSNATRCPGATSVTIFRRPVSTGPS